MNRLIVERSSHKHKNSRNRQQLRLQVYQQLHQLLQTSIRSQTGYSVSKQFGRPSLSALGVRFHSFQTADQGSGSGRLEVVHVQMRHSPKRIPTRAKAGVQWYAIVASQSLKERVVCCYFASSHRPARKRRPCWYWCW
jgi:hypothetical protein